MVPSGDAGKKFIPSRFSALPKVIMGDNRGRIINHLPAALPESLA